MAHRRFVLKPVMPVPLAKVNATPVSIPAAELVLASIPRTVPKSAAPSATTSTLKATASTPTMVPETAIPVAVALPSALRTVPTPATVPVPRSIKTAVSAPVVLTLPAPPPRVPAPTSRTIAAHPLKSVRADASLTVPAPATKTVLAGAAKPLAATVRTTVPASVSGPQLPAGWNALGATKNGEMRFRTETSAGVTNGQASLDVVAQSRPNPLYLPAREERRLLAGVAIADLRRLVIDKMISDGGWVVNDYFRDVAGQRVFIVSAQTPGDGRSPDKSWNFYFTEVNGRIYRLTTNTPQQFSDRMAAEAESFISSFHAISKPASK